MCSLPLLVMVTIVAIRLPTSHAYGQTGKREVNIVKVSNHAWDTNLISASAVSIILCGFLRHLPFSSPLEYVALNGSSAGGGAFEILLLPSPWGPAPHNPPWKLPAHSPRPPSTPPHDSVVASRGEDGNGCLWKVEPSEFDNYGVDHWEPKISTRPANRRLAAQSRSSPIPPTASHALPRPQVTMLLRSGVSPAVTLPRASLTGATDTTQSIDLTLPVPFMLPLTVIE